tara:strand:+ start:178 stop:369 length:192 start_codon:yes stop_codon:yes gene_type:complete
MFKQILKIFKPKTQIEKLEKRYKNTLAEAFELSKISRTASDAKYAEAVTIVDEIELLKKNVNK